MYHSNTHDSDGFMLICRFHQLFISVCILNRQQASPSVIGIGVVQRAVLVIQRHYVASCIAGGYSFLHSVLIWLIIPRLPVKSYE